MTEGAKGGGVRTLSAGRAHCSLAGPVGRRRGAPLHGARQAPICSCLSAPPGRRATTLLAGRAVCRAEGVPARVSARGGPVRPDPGALPGLGYPVSTWDNFQNVWEPIQEYKKVGSPSPHERALPSTCTGDCRRRIALTITTSTREGNGPAPKSPPSRSQAGPAVSCPRCGHERPGRGKNPTRDRQPSPIGQAMFQKKPAGGGHRAGPSLSAHNPFRMTYVAVFGSISCSPSARRTLSAAVTPSLRATSSMTVARLTG